MKAENSQTTQGSAPIKQKPKAKPIEEEIEEEYNEEIDGDEEVEETPKTVKKPVEEKIDLTEQIRNLHDNGIFRLELLNVLHQINNNLRIVAGVLADYKK